MVVVINGKAGAGKDTFVMFCREYACGVIAVESFSTVDIVKKMLLDAGVWDGHTKGERERQLMCDLKDALTRYGDIPFWDVVRKADETLAGGNAIVLIHCREPQEIQKFKDHYGSACISILIDPGGRVPGTPGNRADMGVMDCGYDAVIHNGGTLHELRQAAAQFMFDIKVRLRARNRRIKEIKKE